jgi:hypothetical protein
VLRTGAVDTLIGSATAMDLFFQPLAYQGSTWLQNWGHGERSPISI